MATESKWAEQFWSVVTLMAAVAGGGACVNVMIGPAPAPAPAMPVHSQSVPNTPCYQPPPIQNTCGSMAR